MNRLKHHLSLLRKSESGDPAQLHISTRLMTHLVAGYPNFETNLQMASKMEQAGVSVIEVQIPHSDPLADGPTIMQANQTALDLGVKVRDCFGLFQKMRHLVGVPLLVMSYYNILYKMGLDVFLEKCVEVGIDGLIVPDIPYDEQRENFFQKVGSYNLVGVPVISPQTSSERRDKIVEIVREQGGFLYLTLKTGTTGTSIRTESRHQSLNYLKDFKTAFPDITIAVGFGIQQKSDLEPFSGLADFIVIGSKVIQLMNTEGITAVSPFLRDLMA